MDEDDLPAFAELRRRFTPLDGFGECSIAVLTPGYQGSRYSWTMAVLDTGPKLPISADPERRERVFKLEQQLIVLDQLFADVLLALPRDSRLRRDLDHIRGTRPGDPAHRQPSCHTVIAPVSGPLTNANACFCGG